MRAPYRQTSSTAIVSLIFGILGWTALPVVGGLIAVITGHLARAEIRRDPERLEGDGMAVAGLVLGWMVILLGFLLFLSALVFLGGLAAVLALAGVAAS